VSLQRHCQPCGSIPLRNRDPIPPFDAAAIA
jgi:hypothetical protein